MRLHGMDDENERKGRKNSFVMWQRDHIHIQYLAGTGGMRSLNDTVCLFSLTHEHRHPSIFQGCGLDTSGTREVLTGSARSMNRDL